MSEPTKVPTKDKQIKSYRLPPALIKRMERFKRRQGQSFDSIVAAALEAYLDAHEADDAATGE